MTVLKLCIAITVIVATFSTIPAVADVCSEIVCANGGTFVRSICRCECFDHWHGKTCEKCSIVQCADGSILNLTSCTCETDSTLQTVECDLTCKNGGTISNKTCKCECAGVWTGYDCGVYFQQDRRADHLSSSVVGGFGVVVVVLVIVAVCAIWESYKFRRNKPKYQITDEQKEEVREEEEGSA